MNAGKMLAEISRADKERQTVRERERDRERRITLAAQTGNTST